MISSSIPTKFVEPFANGATGTNITYPVPKAATGVPGRASLDTGFPPETFQPVEGGGTPPWGADVNGVLKQVSAWSMWYSAGGPIAYDATLQAAIGGYPKGAIVQSVATFGQIWLNNTEANTTNPDTGGAGWQSLFTTPTNITGNAGTATKLATARTISMSGDATWSVSFDGSATATATVSVSVATALRTGRTIGMTGDVVWTSSAFTGAGNVSGTATLAATGVTPGTYNNVTVNAKGLVTNGSVAGYITGNQLITLSGDVSGSGSTSIGVTIGANAVSNSKLAQMVTHTIKGNATGVTGNPTDLTGAQVTALLSVFTGDSGAGGAAGIVPAPPAGSKAANAWLGAGGVWVNPFKAWVQFTFNGSTCAVVAGFNVSGVVRNGLGDYTATFTNAVSTPYFVWGNQEFLQGNGLVLPCPKSPIATNNGTNACDFILVQTGSGNHQDPPNGQNVWVFFQ